MDTQIAYNRQEVLTQSAYVEDVGNCALEAVDEDGLNHYLVIKTVDGQTFKLMFGPLLPDIIELPPAYNITYIKDEYNDTKLAKFIQGWAAPKKGANFESVKQIPMEEALSLYRDVKSYFENQQ